MRLSLFSSIIAFAAAADYSKMYDNAAGWGSVAGWEACNKPGQAPIDLKDDFKKVYYENDMQFTGYDKGWQNGFRIWDVKHALQVMANRDKLADGSYTTNAQMGFTSKHGASLGFSGLWNPLQFHVHTPSEHTINGKLFDLEMHMVHLPVADATAAQSKASFGTALTFIFDTTNFDSSVSDAKDTVDNFFKKWVNQGQNQNIEMGTLVGDLIKKVDFNDRWSYEGSLTTPPCTKNAFFNIARKVYPVSADVVKLVKDKMKAESGNKFFSGAADEWKGNNRPPQPLNGQNPVIIVNGVDPNANADKEAAARSQTLFIVFLILFFLALIGFIVVCTMLCKAQSDSKTGETELPQASVEAEVKQNNA